MTVLGEDLVVLLDDDGRHIGSAPRATVHQRNTPLHLGFSCYLFDGAGRVLMTRRSLNKRTWPGVWTNSCCGHPRPGEPTAQAVVRRALEELGLSIDTPSLVLPSFRYRATGPDGIVENEICPVFIAAAHGVVRPAGEEVMAWRWTSWAEAVTLAATPGALSPWAAEQIPLLVDAGIDGITK
jgi:isopentenyl-diphosphate delta-isomerase